ncbi:hypothetical protein FA95DRAFT_1557873 [Auriscalpium vulgare]|uniref:Uncharacterized protein n=1 Tax=Auriscalpium vulgare TaxID=40419 RepID=A0ACB8RWB4_9AGAM|nr:hypothetical protein FA95DRAFT_1557873 [Auriscalpium vulgare]
MARLSVADILHRGVVTGLVGVCVWGIGIGFMVHRDTIRRGHEILAERQAAGLPVDVVPQKEVQERNEQIWAGQALHSVFRKSGPVRAE